MPVAADDTDSDVGGCRVLTKHISCPLNSGISSNKIGGTNADRSSVCLGTELRAAIGINLDVVDDVTVGAATDVTIGASRAAFNAVTADCCFSVGDADVSAPLETW